jgi:RNA polymerase sigma-70 factor (ECF subfamily)
LLAHLADNVVLVSDAGGKPGALLRPIQGADPVARVMIAAVRRHGVESAEIESASINGLPGFVRYQHGQARAVLVFGLAGGRIAAVFVISNPDKLRHLSRDGSAASRG